MSISVDGFVSSPNGENDWIFNDVARPLDLKLVDVKAFPGGIVAKTYRI